MTGPTSTDQPTLVRLPEGPSVPSVDLAVVGAGASATFLLAAIRRRWVGDLPRAALIEKGRCPGPGVAYRTDDPRHRMNVRVCQLTAHPDEPDHFLTWARAVDPAITADDYAPRGLYGRYLTAVLDEATQPPARVQRLQGEVTSVLQGPPWPAPREPRGVDADGVLLVGREGPIVRADHVVLAVGVPPTGPRRFRVAPDAPAGDAYVDDPWRPEALAGLRGRDHVVVVGTGLTMVDVALTLLGRHGVGEVTAVSTTGRLPAAHDAVRATATRPIGRPAVATARGVLAWLREVIDAEPAGWAAAVDGVRWSCPDIWASLPLGEQARLLRLGASRWSRVRHRLPPAVAEEVAAARRAGRLRLVAGRVEEVGSGLNGPEVRVRRPSAPDLALAADAVVNCTGPPGVWATSDPLVRDLVDTGTVGVGPHGLGLAVAEDGAVLDPSGHPLPQLSVLGALRRGTEFEATAVPELRLQADHLVRRLARSVARHR